MDPFSISPREAWLERELGKVKGKLEYLERQQGLSYSTLFPVQQLELETITPTLKLHTYASMKRSDMGDLHCLVKEERYNGISLGYYLSSEDMSIRDRAAILMSMHEKLAYTAAEKFWG